MREAGRGGWWKVCVAFLVWMFLFGGMEHARADGKFYPSRSMLAPPTIPSQRALVLHRDGEQTLVVESSMRGEPGEYGWLLPVPAVPRAFGTVSPQIFGNLSATTSPLRWKSTFNKPLIALLFIGLVLFALTKISPGLWRAEWHAVPGGILLSLIFVLLFILTFLSSPLMRAVKDSMADGVTVHAWEEVGLHDVAVLEAQTPEALDAWLDANGFQGIPSEQTAIVESYIDSGWVFVATRFNATATDLTTPDPLRITFPTGNPVYPMRLTRAAVTEEGLHVTLFVVGGEAFGHAELDVEFADRFFLQLPGGDMADAAESTDSSRDAPHYVGAWYGGVLGHPDLLALFWDGCVVTRLAGTVLPARMEGDFWLEPGGRIPVRNEFFATPEVSVVGVLEPTTFFLGVMLSCMIVLFVGIPLVSKEGGVRAILLLILMLYAGGTALVFAGLFPKLAEHRPFAPVHSARHHSRYLGRIYHSTLEGIFERKGYPASVEEARASGFDRILDWAGEDGFPAGELIEDGRGVVLRQLCPVRYVPLDLVLSDPDALGKSCEEVEHLLHKAAIHAGRQVDRKGSGGILGVVFSLFFAAGFILLWDVSGRTGIDGKPRRVTWGMRLPYLCLPPILIFLMTRTPVVFAPFVPLGYFDGDTMVLVSLCLFGVGALFGGVGRRVRERMCAGG